MKKANVIVMDYDEFDDLIGEVSNGEAGIANESGEWFYVSTENYNADNIEEDLGYHLNVNIKSVVVDITKDQDGVVIICK